MEPPQKSLALMEINGGGQIFLNGNYRKRNSVSVSVRRPHKWNSAGHVTPYCAMHRPSRGPTIKLISYLDQFWDPATGLLYGLLLPECMPVLFLLPDHTEARIRLGSVRASPHNEPYTIPSHCSGPYATI